MVKTVNNIVMQHGTYKIVALLISLVLWVTLLGHRDLVLNENLTIQIIVPYNYFIRDRIPNYVKVKVSGSRFALKKFVNNKPIVKVVIPEPYEGLHFIKIKETSLEVPLGVKVLSIQPEEIQLKAAKKLAN